MPPPLATIDKLGLPRLPVMMLSLTVRLPLFSMPPPTNASAALSATVVRLSSTFPLFVDTATTLGRVFNHTAV